MKARKLIKRGEVKYFQHSSPEQRHIWRLKNREYLYIYPHLPASNWTKNNILIKLSSDWHEISLDELKRKYPDFKP